MKKLFESILCFFGFHNWIDIHQDRIAGSEHYTSYVGDGCMVCDKRRAPSFDLFKVKRFGLLKFLASWIGVILFSLFLLFILVGVLGLGMEIVK